jgi:tritrans,polycis-undecaprenyl-diphosphate synthase [geranylgeranyl-diphosphate specific]
MHTAIILDGNRRYAEKKKLFPRFLGHKEGEKTLKRLLLYWFKMKGPKHLSLYVFSLYNLKNRNPIEKHFIFKLFEKGFEELLLTKEIHKQKIHVSFIGKKEACPKSFRELMEKIEDKTKDYKNKFLNFCVCYDGQEEITNAFNNMLKNNIKKADEKTIKKCLYTREIPVVDLVIRTGGEKRLSGFLLWDTSYAEMIFKEETWPEYTPDMFEEDLEEFRRRKRRFGK